MHFYATFGQKQYGGILKDYYVEIVAPDIAAAMKLMRETFDNRYSNCYEGLPDENTLKFYPKGCLGRLETL